MEKKEYIAAINNILEELTVDSLKAVYQMAVICRSNEKNIANHTIKSNKGKKIS